MVAHFALTFNTETTGQTSDWFWGAIKSAFSKGEILCFDDEKNTIDVKTYREKYSQDIVDNLGLYGESTTSDEINKWLEKIGSPHRFPNNLVGRLRHAEEPHKEWVWAIDAAQAIAKQQAKDFMEEVGLTDAWRIKLFGYIKDGDILVFDRLEERERKARSQEASFPVNDYPVKKATIDAWLQTIGKPAVYGTEQAIQIEQPTTEQNCQTSANITSAIGLDTAQIASAFYFVEGLKAKLGDVNNHKWLLPARLNQGKAPKPATWCPLKLAELLVNKVEAKEQEVNEAFLQPSLRVWRDMWQERRRERNAFGL